MITNYSFLLNYTSMPLYSQLAVITRPPDGVLLLPPAALAARRLRRLASLVAL